MLLVLLVVGLFCKDVWGSKTAGCRDIDTRLGVYDADGRWCNFYDARPDQCGQFDDDDFESARLCCACKGGEMQGSKSSTTTFRGTLPPRQTINRTPNRHTTVTPPTRKPGCFAFDEDEMRSANCDLKNAKNCVDALPGGGKRCHFTCAPGYLPPGGDKEQLYMLCDRNGKWHANAKCEGAVTTTRTLS